MDDYLNFLKNFRTKRFKKGEIILVQGEVPECAYAVKSGIVKTYNLTLAGEEKPIGFDLDTEIFPLAWAFGKVNHVQFYYEAFTETAVYCIPTAELQKFFASHGRARAFLLDQLISAHMHTQLRINALEQSKASQKVLNTIHFLCLRFGVEQRKNVVQIRLPLTQQDLANFIGLTRETTGIELKKLHQKGVLSYKKQNYVVRTDKLDGLLDEDYGLGIVFKKAAIQIVGSPKKSP
ncbi:MAG TPA: Crp/Fnr family transcriptional regulator [Candidatus Limnocylindria bacterium]|nr:Crp/Fnr family transcriptional regulator [Candidatus Limnocylindria bacterium]